MSLAMEKFAIAFPAPETFLQCEITNDEEIGEKRHPFNIHLICKLDETKSC